LSFTTLILALMGTIDLYWG